MDQPWLTKVVPREAYLDVMKMLVKRATFWDKFQAARDPSHWFNRFKREVAQDAIDHPPAGKGLFD